MDENVKKRNECLAQTVIKGLQSRNMSGYYAPSKEAALKQALELIPQGSSIAMGGCMSAHEIGLINALEAGNYNYIDRYKMEPREGLMAAYNADVFLSSANALTDDGILINIDGNSNRVSCIAQGPKKVIFIVGINKICNVPEILLHLPMPRDSIFKPHVKRPENALTANPRTLSAASSLLQDTPDTKTGSM